MKQLLIIAFLVLTCSLQGQRIIDETIRGNIAEIVLDGNYSDYEIETYDGDELLIKGTVSINLNLDNDAFEMKIEQNNGRVAVTTQVDSESVPKRVIGRNNNGEYIILSKNGDEDHRMILKESGAKYDMINYGMQSDISLKFMVPKDKSLRVKHNYGDVSITGQFSKLIVSLVYGDLDVIQDNISSTTDIILQSTYGHVDYTLPSEAALKFEVSSEYGEVLTDLDLVSMSNKENTKGMRCYGTKGVFALNNGVDIATVKSTYDNVYLRAKK